MQFLKVTANEEMFVQLGNRTRCAIKIVEA